MTKLNSEESHIPFVDGILSQLGIEMNEPSHDLRELKFSYLNPNSDLDKADDLLGYKIYSNELRN